MSNNGQATIRRNVFIFMLVFVFILTSCQAGASTAKSDMWSVEIVSAETAESLTATLAAVQYSGDVLETTSEVMPDEGNTFLLIEMNIEKIGSGKGSFSWNDAHITDNDGNVYYRHPNDTFLSNVNIPRMKGTDIVFGKEYGYVCFEIYKGAKGLQFIADNGNVKLGVRP